MQRRKTAQRAFRGLVGLLPEPAVAGETVTVMEPQPATLRNHLRHCPRHRKPLPCPHCALIAEAKERAEARRREAAKSAEPVAGKRSRGRPKKYANDAARKAEDAQRKQDERAIPSRAKVIDQVQTEHHDFAGAQGEASGGFDMVSIAQKVDGYQKGAALGDDPDYEISVPDRKRTAVPVSQDDREDEVKETDNTHINTVLRREARSLRAWIRGPQEYKRPCVEFHAGIAEKNKDSKMKVVCGRCGKLLVNPGKVVKGITPNIPDVVQEPAQ